MTLQTELGNISDTASAQVAALWALVESGDLTIKDFVTAASTIIGEANARAWTVGQAAIAATVAHATLARASQPDIEDQPLGLTLAAAGLTLRAVQPTHYLDVPRLRQAVSTVVAGPKEQAVTRLDRLARSEPAEAGQRAANRALARYPGVKGWTRSIGPKACQLCVWWARGGQVFPPTHTMPTHKGCLCTPAPVLA